MKCSWKRTEAARGYKPPCGRTGVIGSGVCHRARGYRSRLDLRPRHRRCWRGGGGGGRVGRLWRLCSASGRAHSLFSLLCSYDLSSLFAFRVMSVASNSTDSTFSLIVCDQDHQWISVVVWTLQPSSSTLSGIRASFFLRRTHACLIITLRATQSRGAVLTLQRDLMSRINA